MADVKETKEAILAVFVLGKFVAERLKDGVDLSDAVALASKLAMDKEFSTTINEGIKGYDLIAGELADLSFDEVVELLGVVVPILGSFKK